MAKKAVKKGKEPTFEEAMERLEGIVGELEKEDLPLEKSLEVFEEGVRLSRFLGGKLNEAEQKVEILLRGEDGERKAGPFSPDDEEAKSEDQGLPF